ncbi:ferrous iron transport protein A [Blattabacterium sp. (Blattella germanica) str. Bge]|uniref:FeoA family protein n=1 Tax=Blattabacterium sp. (Blattella germanica) TaxID=624186 RepID=UPI0001BB60D5|nr:FeoA family protein [Blattabacterium sp. (Blattella germanica)]ACY40159.1 ferrous iron transport protein A [Blattabacterium sp. (Blattella germanica) str. Bge]
MNLSNLKKGEKGIIKGYKNEDFPIKLLELGILPGVEFEILFVSIFYDPLCISYNQSCLALRRKEAENIIIEPIQCKEE